VIQRRQIDDRLSQPRAKIDVVEWPDNGREVESRYGRRDPDTGRPEIYLLRGLGRIDRDVRQHRASTDLLLSARLTQHFSQPDRTEVIAEAAFYRIPKRKLSIKGMRSGARSTAVIRPLHHDGRIERVHTRRGSRYRQLNGRHRSTLCAAAGQ